MKTYIKTTKNVRYTRQGIESIKNSSVSVHENHHETQYMTFPQNCSFHEICELCFVSEFRVHRKSRKDHVTSVSELYQGVAYHNSSYVVRLYGVPQW